MSSYTPVGPGTKVEVRFSLKLTDGHVVDSTGDNAASFVVGDGSLLPGFEQAMFGMVEGQASSFEIEDGFGEHNEDNVQRMPRTQFASDMKLAEGLIVSFADQQKTELPGVVTNVSELIVEVDFNHPLAGKKLIFDVEIIGVKQITNDIVRVR
ncbi:MAG: peptidylprolyl isomerase [Pseudomonadales bacterium]|nr:peptidylprolyl isomerase [Pseudomonadales bacterium]